MLQTPKLQANALTHNTGGIVPIVHRRRGIIPVPIPVTTVWSVPPIIPAETTDGVTGPCGAMLGRYMQPKPSLLISNSTNDGVMAAP